MGATTSVTDQHPTQNRHHIDPQSTPNTKSFDNNSGQIFNLINKHINLLSHYHRTIQYQIHLFLISGIYIFIISIYQFTGYIFTNYTFHIYIKLITHYYHTIQHQIHLVCYHHLYLSSDQWHLCI